MGIIIIISIMSFIAGHITCFYIIRGSIRRTLKKHQSASVVEYVEELKTVLNKMDRKKD